MRRVTVLFAALIEACSTGPSDSHVPELGRYAFVSEWPVPGFATPARVEGDFTISSANESGLAWALSTVEVSGQSYHQGAATWDEGNDYLLTGIVKLRAGTWNLIPHFKRTGATYECYGKAVTNSYPPAPGDLIHNQTMTCSFTYLGP